MGQNTSTIVMLVALFAVMYFFMIRPENKRKKEAQALRAGLKKGDVVTTIGGLVGKVVQVNENTVIIETSDDRVRFEITKWAISTNGVQTSNEPTPTKNSKKEPAKIEEAPAETTAEAPSEEEK